MITMVATAVVVFVGVTALSRASAQQLDTAISQEAGGAGTYRVSFGSDLGLGGRELAATVQGAVAPLQSRPVRVAEILPASRAECPPFSTMGSPTLKVIRDAHFRPSPANFGRGLPENTLYCLAGLSVPREALAAPGGEEKVLWGAESILLDAAYAHQVALTGTRPIQYEFIVVTGRTQDMSPALDEALRQAFDPRLARTARESYGSWTVLRIDTSPEIRAAGQAVAAVYATIGWGVLVLGGLGVLVAQLILLRDRMWFFGLSRALGADRMDVMLLVLLDVVLVVFCGAAVGVGIVLASASVIATVGRQAFGVPLDGVAAAASPELALGLLVVVLLGASYPVHRVGRLDPVDILEGR